MVGVWRQLSNFQLFISWWEQVISQWNDNEVRFVLIWFYIYLPYLGDMVTEMDLQRNTHIIPHAHRHYQNKYVGDIFPAWRTMVAETDLQCKTHFIPHAPSTSGVFKFIAKTNMSEIYFSLDIMNNNNMWRKWKIRTQEGKLLNCYLFFKIERFNLWIFFLSELIGYNNLKN